MSILHRRGVTFDRLVQLVRLRKFENSFDEKNALWKVTSGRCISHKIFLAPPFHSKSLANTLNIQHRPHRKDLCNHNERYDADNRRVSLSARQISQKSSQGGKMCENASDRR